MACSGLLLAACGGEDAEVERRTDTRPTIARPIADRLASRSDQVATMLDGGDSCGAAREAAALRDDVIATINGRDIPDAYLEDLLGAVHELEAQIPSCEPPNGDGGDEGRGKDKKKRKHNDGGEGDD
jgi:hypothetical protein